MSCLWPCFLGFVGVSRVPAGKLLPPRLQVRPPSWECPYGQRWHRAPMHGCCPRALSTKPLQILPRPWSCRPWPYAAGRRLLTYTLLYTSTPPSFFNNACMLQRACMHALNACFRYVHMPKSASIACIHPIICYIYIEPDLFLFYIILIT